MESPAEMLDWRYAMALPSNLIRQLAADRRREAVELDLLASRREKLDAAARRARKRRRKIMDAVDVLARYLHSGMPEHTALKATTTATGHTTPERLLPMARKALKPMEREIRNRRIWQAVRAGKTDAEIGAAEGLHPKTVNRIWRKKH